MGMRWSCECGLCGYDPGEGLITPSEAMEVLISVGQAARLGHSALGCREKVKSARKKKTWVTCHWCLGELSRGATHPRLPYHMQCFDKLGGEIPRKHFRNRAKAKRRELEAHRKSVRSAIDYAQGFTFDWDPDHGWKL